MPSSGDLADPGIESTFPALTGGFFTTEPSEKPFYHNFKKQHRQHCTYNQVIPTSYYVASVKNSTWMPPLDSLLLRPWTTHGLWSPLLSSWESFWQPKALYEPCTLLYEVANRSDHQPHHQKVTRQKESGKVLPIPELLTRNVALINWLSSLGPELVKCKERAKVIFKFSMSVFI